MLSSNAGRQSAESRQLNDGALKVNEGDREIGVGRRAINRGFNVKQPFTDTTIGAETIDERICAGNSAGIPNG